jgi:hypothetical protein
MCGLMRDSQALFVERVVSVNENQPDTNIRDQATAQVTNWPYFEGLDSKTAQNAGNGTSTQACNTMNCDGKSSDDRTFKIDGFAVQAAATG